MQYRLWCDIIGDVRVVADTDVIVAAMRSPGGATAAILRAARQSKITLLVSVPLAVEYEATCSEAEHRLAAGLSEREVEIFLDAVMAMAEPVKTHFLWRPQLRDPGDEMVLETAVNGRADGLVTFNVRDFGTVPARFGIEVMIPSKVIGRMRRWRRQWHTLCGLPRSLKRAVERQSKEDRTSINQFVATAVAEKLSALQTAEFFADRKARADFRTFDKLMKRRGGRPPRVGDEMPGSKTKAAR
jgi:putative PIN family toxin of toxin-antitoxin system